VIPNDTHAMIGRKYIGGARLVLRRIVVFVKLSQETFGLLHNFIDMDDVIPIFLERGNISLWASSNHSTLTLEKGL
jgi:hypothetical protein